MNKVDNPEMRNEIYDFYSLGFGDPYPISGSHGLGLGDLLDEVVKISKKKSPIHMTRIQFVYQLLVALT